MFDSTSYKKQVPISTSKQESKTLPSSSISLSFLHMQGKPFCSSEHCSCHQNQTQIALLLEAVKNGEMTLREAANVADGKTL